MEGDFSFREVMRDTDGDICGIAPHDAAPMGETIEGLAFDLGLFIKALEMPFLCEEDLEYEEDQEVGAPMVHTPNEAPNTVPSWRSTTDR